MSFILSTNRILPRHVFKSIVIRLSTTEITKTDPQKLEPHQEAGEKAATVVSSFPHISKSMETRLSHAGVDSSRDNAPMSPSLELATTYGRPASGLYGDSDYVYARDSSPTVSLLERTMAQLECLGGDHTSSNYVAKSFSFASGMAAVTAIIMAHGTSTTVFVPQDVYHGVPTVLADVLNPMGVKWERINFQNLKELLSRAQAVVTDNLVVWIETPSNPQCQVIDIAAVCSSLQSVSILATLTTVVDSTMSPPCLTQPLRLGADIVLHSATKYLGGHSDALLGIVTVSPWTQRGKEFNPALENVRIQAGAVASPFDAWLTLRGLRTLHLRVERASNNALRLAQFLESCASVRKVHYPGLSSHPQHAIAAKQMGAKNQFGGVLSFEMNTDVEAMAFAGALRIAQRATSLGGTETLVEHRASIEPPGRVVSPPGLLRVSVGIENIDDLLQDFKTAIAISSETSKEFLK
jgi:cystathionine gamma-synthase